MNIQIISASFALGIYFADKIGLFNILLVCISLFPIAVFGLIFRRTIYFTVFLAMCITAAGAAAYKFSVNDEFYKSSSFYNQEITATGRVCDIPYKSGNIMKYTVAAKHISDGNSQTDINEKLVMYSDAEFEYGDTVTFRGTLLPIPHKRNEGDFETEKYYKQRGISAKITADSIDYSSEKITDNSLTNIANSIRNSIDHIIDKYYTGDRAAVVKAVLTGNKNGFSPEMKKTLTRTGTGGIFYPAYIHIMLISFIIGASTAVTKQKHRDAAMIVIFSVYALINSGHASFVRGCMFMALIAASRLFLKKVRYIDVFAAVILICAIISPLILFEFGFIASALSALSIKAFYRYIIDKLHIKNSSYLLRTFVLHIICVVCMIPVTAYYFNYITVYSVVISIIILPVVAGMLIMSPLFLATVKIFGTAPLAGQFMTAMTSILLSIPKITDKLPFSKIYIRPSSVTVLAAYVCILLGLAYIIRKKKQLAENFLIVGIAFTVTAVAVGLWKLNKIEIDFVNVGQGDGAVVHMPLGANILIDGGGSAEFSDYDIGENVYLPYLLHHGVTEADAAFVSHYHKDHVQGLAAALENIKVKNIFMPEGMRGCEWCKILEEKAKENGTTLHYIGKNTKIKFNNGLTIDVTVPNNEVKMSDDENDTSMMMNVSYGEFNCLFTGDMTTAGENVFVNKGIVPTAEVLKIAHHGSKRSTSEEFYKSVSPQYSVISLGEKNIYNFPAERVLDTIKTSDILRTDINGDIKIISDKKANITVDTLR